jgi:Carboxypeptidase regulatory-like domain
MNKRTRFLVAFALILLASAAQATTVRGRVLRPDGRLNPGAAVLLQNAAIGSTATVYAAADGVFTLRNIPPGDYTMRVRTSRGATDLRVSVSAQPTVNLPDVRVP